MWILLLGFTEILTVYSSIKTGGRQDDQSCWIHGSREDMKPMERLSPHVGRWLWSQRKGCHYTMEEVRSKPEEITSTVWELFKTEDWYTSLWWDLTKVQLCIHLVNFQMCSCQVCSPSGLDRRPSVCVHQCVWTHFSEPIGKPSLSFICHSAFCNYIVVCVSVSVFIVHLLNLVSIFIYRTMFKRVVSQNNFWISIL